MAQPYAPLVQQMLRDFQNQQLEPAERMAQSILRINPKDLIALQVQGLIFAMQGRSAQAVEPLSRAAQQDPKNPELLSNLAKAQHGANLFEQAVQTYEKLSRLVKNNPQILTDMGTSYAKLRSHDQAAACYEKAIALQPNYFLAHSNQGNLLAELGYAAQAVESYELALKLNPNYPEAWTNYGNALFKLDRLDDARQAHEKALEIDSQYGEAWSNLGNTFVELKLGDEAFECYQKAFALKPFHPYLMGQFLAAKLTTCDWDSVDSFTVDMMHGVEQQRAVCIPFALLQTPAALDLQKRCAQIYVADRYSQMQKPSFSFPKKGPGKKIRIGYFSSDFKNHPVGILMENLIRLHDRSAFEVFGFFLSARCADAVETRLNGLFDQTVDLFGLADPEAQRLVLEKQIDIAIDLNGHTSGARTALFAMRLAPVQVNYLGYAGTSGANFYDCLVADQVVIPSQDQAHYTEKIAYLPHCFFPVDTSIRPEQFGALPSKVSQGLPETGFIFTCFNNIYKLNPAIFSIWMDLLKQVPGSVLWLSKPSEKAIRNLQKEAEARGIDSARLVFAIRVPERVDHLSRLRLADLFLDTPNYNAHATAADALWTGVPVLTIQGNTFAARVAASQLTALELPDLITHSTKEYQAKALELARYPERLKVLKERIETHRSLTPLFNTRQYLHDLEGLYKDLLENLPN
jgi:predicted O-linked N-acetylglucosamine transferase (SPINDLY family)